MKCQHLYFNNCLWTHAYCIWKKTEKYVIQTNVGGGKPQTSGDHLSGPTAVCLLPWGWSWGCYHLPASASPVSPRQSRQRWTRPSSLISHAPVTQSSLFCCKGNSKSLHNLLDYWVLDRQTTVYATEGMSVWAGGKQHMSTAGGCTLTFPLHPVHLRLPI